MFCDCVEGHDSSWAAMRSVASKLGCSPETLRSWIRQAETDNGQRTGVTTAETARMKELERECVAFCHCP